MQTAHQGRLVGVGDGEVDGPLGNSLEYLTLLRVLILVPGQCGEFIAQRTQRADMGGTGFDLQLASGEFGERGWFFPAAAVNQLFRDVLAGRAKT